MGPIAGRHARAVLGHVETILAIEALCAAQALDLRLSALPGVAPGAGVTEAHRIIRRAVAHLDRDRELGVDLDAACRLVRDGALATLASPGV
jgi:histidine ammonia-lyase